MTVDQIRALRDATPFKPFMLTLDDGRELLIENHYYIGISPRQDLILAVTRDRGTAWFAPERVKEARPIRMIAS